jgi:NAD(P)-dependent dehydrogenase (short-subunit alcohol dehydrogenase family)
LLGQTLQGQRILVVGASSGIGREVVAQVTARGAQVVAAARRIDRLREISSALAVCCDVRDENACTELVQQAVQLTGGLDAIIYAAGIGKFTPLDRAGRDDWLEILETNLIGAALVTRAALPHLCAEESQGRALFLTSDATERGYPGLIAYAASKSGLSRFCQGLRAEFPQLRVSEVLVGPTGDTDVADHMDPDLIGYWVDRWYNEGWVRYEMQTPADVAGEVIEALIQPAPAPLIRAHGLPTPTGRPLESLQ